MAETDSGATLRGPDDLLSRPAPEEHPLRGKRFSDAETRIVRGEDGIPGMIPARCYYDQDMYAYEVEHILKKNWLVVGRWDDAEAPGDYFTRRMFGESILVVRGRDNELRAFINVCRHRWSQLVPDGKGNAKLLICAYHSWAYELTGKLRGVAIQPLLDLDKAKCNLHQLRLEIWQGFVFINFDPDAQPLHEQLTGLTEIVEPMRVGEFRMLADHVYETSWNYKFAFETGFETYHHEGVHRDLLAGTSEHFKPFANGTNWGVIKSVLPVDFPFGRPSQEGDAERPDEDVAPLIVGIYPHNIMVFTPHRLMWIATEHMEITHNRATLGIAVASWADGQEADFSVKVHEQDKDGCRLLQKGITSSYNDRSYIHPLEAQMSHYFNWFADQYGAAKAG
jgi:phenylpropionate dioxygenase-like ring-hydroxylating dioxygenase large terminal subunit